MKKLFFTLLLLIVFPVLASHIVGGEFELLHISGNSYKLNMILYFDKLNGSAGARDTSVTASIYSKGTNKWIRDITLHLYTETPVGYTQPACSSGELLTSKIFYSTSITLSPDIYNEPAGYYVSWQRCCRNYSITNIHSDDPNTGIPGISAGQTFYMEFPPVVKDGVPFYNSSPRLFPPLNDYACPQRPYYVNFQGVDDDGDSLVYTMVTPLSTTTYDPLPPRSPAAYPTVTWMPGFGLSDIIDGSPDLTISYDGYLRCTPIPLGLFVFAVKIQQFRNKVKIGETRRDFQMLVTDGCQPDAAPVIVGKTVTDGSFPYSGTMDVTFNNVANDADRCIQVRVSDADSQSSLSKYTENIGIRIIPIGFTSDEISSYLPSVTTATLSHGSTKDFSICFPQCPPVKSGKFQIGIIAYDDACSLPELDTLKVNVTILPPPNTPPHFTAPAALPVTVTLNESQNMSWPISIVDDENDSITYSLVGNGFDPAKAGVTFTVNKNQKGLITGTLTWDAYCDIYDYTKQTSFLVRIVANDLDLCNADDPTVGVFNLNVILPGVAPVFIDTDLTSDPNERTVTVERKVGQSLDFNVTGRQADNDLLKLGVLPQGFVLSDAKMTFPLTSANGTVVSPFNWTITCDDVDLTKKDQYNMWFTVLDNTNKCKVPKWDSVQVIVNVSPADNTKPTFVMQSMNSVPLVDGHTSIKIGETIAINFSGVDIDPPLVPNGLQLQLAEAKGTEVAPDGYTFVNISGENNVESPFVWTPACTIFKNNVYTNDYTFRFILNDKTCFNPKADTLILYVEVSDIVSDFKLFTPPNIITPNGDNCNDYFALEGLDDDPEAIANCHRIADGADNLVHLPPDNCSSQFKFIHIYNRWGKQVFKSADRKFRWYAQSADSGTYFYLIEFGSTKYKGTLAVQP